MGVRIRRATAIRNPAGEILLLADPGVVSPSAVRVSTLRGEPVTVTIGELRRWVEMIESTETVTPASVGVAALWRELAGATADALLHHNPDSGMCGKNDWAMLEVLRVIKRIGTAHSDAERTE